MTRTRILVILLLCSLPVGAGVFWSLNLRKGSTEPAPADVFTVSGTVVDEGTKKTLAGVRVSMKDSEGESLAFMTGPNGRYNFLCRPGTYILNVSLDDYKTYLKQVTVENTNMTINISLTSLILPPPSSGANITGRVTDAKTGLPIRGAVLKAGNYSTTTKTDGVYSLVVEVGTYTLTVSFTGYKIETARVEAPEEKTYSIDFSMTPIPTVKVTAIPSYLFTYNERTSFITVVVKKADRTPAAGVTIRFTDETEGMPAKFDSEKVVTDDTGRATVKWRTLVEPIGLDSTRQWVCFIIASANVEGWQVEGRDYITVTQPCDRMCDF